MNGRPWSKHDQWRLMSYAEYLSQADAARLLGRTLHAVQSWARAHGIAWRGGLASPAKIAQEFGCSPTTVCRMVRVLGMETRVVGKGTGHRYLLDEDSADRVRAVLSRTLVRREKHRIAGRRRAELRQAAVTVSADSL